MHSSQVGIRRLTSLGSSPDDMATSRNALRYRLSKIGIDDNEAE
jgi:hypothetical protein